MHNVRVSGFAAQRPQTRRPPGDTEGKYGRYNASAGFVYSLNRPLPLVNTEPIGFVWEVLPRACACRCAEHRKLLCVCVCVLTSHVLFAMNSRPLATCLSEPWS